MAPSSTPMARSSHRWHCLLATPATDWSETTFGRVYLTAHGQESNRRVEVSKIKCG